MIKPRIWKLRDGECANALHVTQLQILTVALKMPHLGLEPEDSTPCIPDHYATSKIGRQKRPPIFTAPTANGVRCGNQKNAPAILQPQKRTAARPSGSGGNGKMKMANGGNFRKYENADENENGKCGLSHFHFPKFCHFHFPYSFAHSPDPPGRTAVPIIFKKYFV